MFSTVFVACLTLLVCLLVRQQRCAKATEQNSMKPDEEVARGKGRTHSILVRLQINFYKTDRALVLA